ncbi:carbohydrate ABC transporter permease [Haloarcula onubensis]|uniref:Carbohydrate ABC transporter permease n=1 Tax=Haloarcula onubensis TaxID=2950539 RepID=A0ABU2FUR0_9EURY|nr:carbohydrate ABC transporter permease [Halomicroarcula sp. S3CR25-11]MDS0284495.1 carbohydrate ABC transporter permease [Halomicroarcula sp. S3CR25-11]
MKPPRQSEVSLHRDHADTDRETVRGQRLARLANAYGDTFARYCFRFGLGVSLVFSLFPLYWLLVVALTPHPTVWTGVGLFPETISPQGFLLATQTVDWGLALFNSLLISVVTTLFVLLVSIPAGYAFGRLDFYGRRPLLAAVLLVAVFPPESIFIPLSDLFRGYTGVFGISPPALFDTHAAVILPSSTLLLPLAIGLLTVFFAGVPDQLEDAARVAGATRHQAMWRVVFPLARPGIASVATLVFIESYTEYFFTSFMTAGAWGAGYTVQTRLHEIITPIWQLGFPNMAAVVGLVGLLPSLVVVLYMSGKLDGWLSEWGQAMQ